MKIRAAILWSVAILCLLSPAAARAQPCHAAACAEWFPDDAGAINVRAYGARGDNRTDDTASLLAAITASGSDTGSAVWHDRIVFLPAGNYVVSATLLKRYSSGGFASGMILVGESADRTVIRLADHAPGYGDPNAPRAVIMTSSKVIDQRGGRDYSGRGEGNDAYENFVESLTVDVGNANPGAIGIDYLANNIGAIRDVAVRAPTGSGAIGIAMQRHWPGPALLQRVSVRGFDVGIATSNTEYGVTLSQVQLTGQRLAGLRNTDNMVSAEGLVVEVGGGTALINATAAGLVMLANGSLVASNPMAAFDNKGTILFDTVHLPPVAATRLALGPGRVSGWLSGSTWHPQVPAWSLLRPQAPVVEADPHESWVGVKGGDDNEPRDVTDALQAALDSGSTVYLRHSTFWISAPLKIPAGLRRLIGMNSTLRVLPQSRGRFPRDQGMLRVLQSGSPLTIERLALDNTDQGEQSGIELAGARKVLIRDVFGAGVITLDRRAGGGTAFLEDTCCGTVHVAGSAQVIARQLNTEGSGIRVLNQGTPMTILGLKTEGYCTVIKSEAGARTEVLGGLLYVVRTPGAEPVPAFVTNNADMVARFVEESIRPNSHYATYLEDLHLDNIRVVTAAEMPWRGLGHIVPMLWSGTPPFGE